jgi:hypothetical protein
VKSNRLKKPLYALVGGLVAAFLCGELIVRIAVGAPLAERLPILRILPHPTRGWRMVPNEDHYTYQHRVRINSHGLRGPEVGQKRHDTLRVLALGDSLTYGQGVGDDETLPALLEHLLNTEDPEGRRWEVINAGHRAYDMGQEVELALEFADEFRPDHVLLFWYRDDLSPRDVEGNYRRISALPTPVAFDTGTRIEGWESVRWHARQFLRRSALAMFVHDTIHRTPSKELRDNIRQAQLKRFDQELARLLSQGEETGFRSWLVPIPHRIHVEHPQMPALLTSGVIELAKRKGLGAVDLHPPLEALLKATSKLPVLPYDGHYDPEANRAMAREVAEALWQLPAMDGR